MLKKIQGYEKYSVSDDGFVFNNKTNRQMRPSTSNRYSSVCLRGSGYVKGMMVHRLVAMAFVKNPDNKPEVNHIDGDRRNNKADNLEWVTRSENMKHAFSIGLCSPKSNIGCFVSGDSKRNDKSKLTADQVRAARFEYSSGSTIKDLSEKYGIDYSNMRRLVLLQAYKNIV